MKISFEYRQQMIDFLKSIIEMSWLNAVENDCKSFLKATFYPTFYQP